MKASVKVWEGQRLLVRAKVPDQVKVVLIDRKPYVLRYHQMECFHCKIPCLFRLLSPDCRATVHCARLLSYQDAVMEVMPGARYEMDLEGLGYTSSRWCKRCRKPKPPMTHHCHICKRCILRMDHHCPWMHNCIGYYNYRFFFIFLLYMWAGCLYSSMMASIPMFYSEDEDSDDDGVGVIFSFVLSVAVLISLSFLLGWHVYLVLTAQTTIDFYGNRQRQREANANGEAWSNIYDLGILLNLRQVLDVGGRWWWLWILLPTRVRPNGDGMYFPVTESYFRPTLSIHPESSLSDICPSTNTSTAGSSLVSDRSSIARERILNDGQWAIAERL